MGVLGRMSGSNESCPLDDSGASDGESRVYIGTLSIDGPGMSSIGRDLGFENLKFGLSGGPRTEEIKLIGRSAA